MVKSTTTAIALAMAVIAAPGHTAPAPRAVSGPAAPALGEHAPANRVLARLQAALFPTLAAMPDTPGWRALVAARAARYQACADPACKLQSGLWSEAELAQVAQGPDAPALRRELAGLNGIIAVYGQGQKPEYPLIDGPDPARAAVNQDIVKAAIERVALLAQADPGLDRGLLLALTLLDGADRLDAIRFGPLARGENAAAFARARHIDWARYRYTAIIVPGIGPEDPDTPLSAGGKANVDLAAARWRAGLAPFIILSGGSVHPRGTTRVEAVEMRKALAERYGVPADALIIDPYARHTTTNLRNAARLLLAMGAPAARPAVIVTHDYQWTYIIDAAFAKRNLSELGYQPMRLGPAPVRNEVPAWPLAVSQTIDPRDPLDP
jgi:hypothetical protein